MGRCVTLASTICRLWLVRSFLGALLVVGILALAAHAHFGSLQTTAAYLRGERLFVTPTEIPLGEIKAGNAQTITVTITNHSDETVRFLGSHAACGCLVAEGFPFDVPGYSSREVRFTIRPNAKTPELDQTVHLYTDSSARRLIRVRVRGSILP